MNSATSDDSVSSRPSVPKGKKAQAKTSKVMGEFKAGQLRSSSGEPVTSRDQAVAIALSEARRAGKKGS